MNIFVLDLDPKLCAKYHCDKHVIKMILEHAQLLCTAHNLNGKISPYKTTHKNHPCAIWVRQSLDNYIWLVEMTKYLNEEYKNRYNKISNHKSYEVITSLPIPDFLEKKGITDMALAMPDECIIEDDVVSSYRNYYIKEKQKLATWKNFETHPEWFIKNI
jgi:hypothetical protein